MGKRIRIVITKNSPIRNGTIPLNIVPMGTSVAILRITKIFTPTGGVIKAISVMIVIKTPNQIGSMPKAIVIGNTKGRVSMIIPNTSRMHPRMV